MMALRHRMLRFLQARLDRFERRDIRAPVTGVLYLQRWTVLRFAGRAVLLHRLMRPDHDRELHDHPWRFVTWVLKGGYIEETAGVPSVRANPAGTIRYNRARFAHRVGMLPDGEAWTLVVRGRRVREWGFFTRCGWQSWRRYFARREAGVPICEDE